MGGRIVLQGDNVCGWVESGCHGDKQVVVHSIASKYILLAGKKWNLWAGSRFH